VKAVLGFAVIALITPGSSTARQTSRDIERADPAADVVRIRAIISTTAPAMSLTLRSGVVVHHSVRVLAGGPAARVTARTGTVTLSRAPLDRTVEAELVLIVAGVTPDNPVEWSATQSSSGTTVIEIYNANDPDRSTLVDRFDLEAASGDFRSPPSALRTGGPLSLRRPVPRLVLAHYYPWYTLETWTNPELLDRPATRYSTDDAAYVLRTMREAKSAGIDGMIVSWQGGDVGDGFNARRMELVLNAAERLGMTACTYLETPAANREHVYGTLPADPDTVFEWIADIVDRYGAHPAHLRVDGRPVVFVYTAWMLAPNVWDSLAERLRRSGRNPLILGEGIDAPWLDPLAGTYRYINIDPPADVERDAVVRSLRTRTYHLLTPARGGRRIWAASVSPGYDESRLSDRPLARVRDRRGGAYYDDQWRAALASAPDWVLITSWNEWWENTHIEPGERYGDLYLRQTKAWVELFHGSRSASPERPLP
jgi:hypothetical protein